MTEIGNYLMYFAGILCWIIAYAAIFVYYKWKCGLLRFFAAVCILSLLISGLYLIVTGTIALTTLAYGY